MKHFILLLLFSAFLLPLSAQTTVVVYSYDGAGNRTQRDTTSVLVAIVPMAVPNVVTDYRKASISPNPIVADKAIFADNKKKNTVKDESDEKI